MNWKPIETAPKDGTPFLGCSTEDYDGCIELLHREPNGVFFNRNSGNYTSGAYWTHWMPLPEPPKA